MTPEELRKRKEFFLSKQRETELELTKLAELERIAAQEEPLRVIVTDARDDRIFFKMSRYDESLLNIFRNQHTRVYHGGDDKLNSVQANHFEFLKEKLAEAKLELIYSSPEVELKVVTLVERPDFQVELDGRGNRLKIKPGPGVFSDKIRPIPGSKWMTEEKVWTIPVWEGWRAHEILKTFKRVEWSSDAIRIVTADMEKRAQLDTLATLKDTELDLDLNGFSLRPFQRVGTKFLIATGYRGILGDKPGLGKTPQAIACVKMLERELGRKVRTGVICPANAKPNWRRQIAKFTTDQAKTYYGLEPRPSDFLELASGLAPNWCIFNYDIIGKRYVDHVDKIDEQGRHIVGDVERYVWANILNMAQFDILIIDEAHYIKNVDSHRSKAVRLLQCPRILFLSGTPITNRPRELWPMLTMINSDLFPSHEVFLGTYEDGNGGANNSKELVELLKPLMIHRSHKDVMADLPPVERIYNFYPLTPKAQKIYNKVLDGIYEDWIRYEGAELTVNHILARIMRLKQVCAIDKVERVAELAVETFDAASDEDTPKVIIFSQFLPVVRGIARRLGHEALICTGDTPQNERPELVYRFQTDPKVHFMVATKGVLSESLDLTAAGYVIFADYFWTPAAHEQCEGRAYGRMDNPHSIVSYYCTSQLEEGSDDECIEEWIQQILARKLATIETVIEGVESSRNASIANELLERLKQELFTRRAR